MMPSANYSTQPWTCKDYDEEECRGQIVQSLTEHYNTIYDCVFLPATVPGASGLLVAAYSNGELRLYNWQRVSRLWLATRTQQSHELSWQAHEGPVYATALLNAKGFGALLVTAGDDGYIRIWRVSDIINAATAAAAAAASSTPSPAAAAAVQLSHAQNPLGISTGTQPAAQALAVDQNKQRVLVGGSDGGIHVVDVATLLAAAAQQQQQQQGLVAAAAAVKAMVGHAAGVLGLDYAAATQQLASSSEDGSIRLWDCSSSSPVCIACLNPWDDPGVIPLNQPRELLRCVKSPAITCVRLSTEGRFLVAGNAGGSLVLWNCMDQSLAAKRNIRDDDQKCNPQVLLLSPGLVTVAGTDKKIHQFTFQLEHVRSLDVGPESVFGIATESETGMLAVCGSRGCLDLLSEQGAVSGLLRPPASVLMG